jgi:carbon starvation protein CstA
MLPVWLLLAPRDYLSTFLKIGVIVALAVGIYLVQPGPALFAFPRCFAESGATRTPIPAQGGQHSGDCGQQVMAA